MKMIRQFAISLTPTEFQFVKADPSTRLYQTKVLAETDKGLTVRVYTNRIDSLIRDFGKVLGLEAEAVKEAFGLETEAEKTERLSQIERTKQEREAKKAQREADKARRAKEVEVRKQVREMIKKAGFKVSDVVGA